MGATESHIAVLDQLHRLAEAMDAADHATLAHLFRHADLVDGISGAVIASGGADAVTHFARIVREHPDGTWRTAHVTTNAIVDVDEGGEAASCRSVYTVFQQTSTLPLQPIIVGRYHDRFTLRDGEWVLTERRYFADLIGELRDHLRFELSPER